MTRADIVDGAVSAVPEAGQVVNVRGANWAVTEVQQQSLPRSAQDDAQQQLQHAVTLQSVEDDRLGEELRVVWELEPGRSLTPPQGLPTEIDPERFDAPTRLAAFIDALRWGAVTSADDKTLQAPFRSGAKVESYQLEPLVRALRAPRVNLLLADDVGLGKTIEAGLVMQELFLRHRARTAIVVCPAGLRHKWKEEMYDKFGLDFTIIDSETMRDVRRTHGVHANPFTLFPRIIVSMPWLPGARAQRQLRDAFHAHHRGASRFAYDILVVDEAHHVAPNAPSRRDPTSRGRGYAVDTQRTIAVRELAERSEHRLFLSATPHNGYTESFTALLEMIDPQRFVRGTAVDPKALGEVAVRRLKRDIPGRFLEREVRGLPYETSDQESEAYERLLAFTKRRDRSVADAKGNRAAKDMATLLLKKRFFSSPASFARTIDVYRETRTGGLSTDFERLYEEVVGPDADETEEGKVEQPEMQTLQKTKNALPALSADDLADLDWLSIWGHRYDARPDARLDALITFVEGVCRPDGQWNNERVVVFTEYVDTLDWIRDIFRQKGWEADRIDVIDGSTDGDQRELIRERFNENPAGEPIRILLATDAAGEGIDLQTHCRWMVNYDIPFNPNRLEQRIGRIDRYGQSQTPQIRHFQPVEATSDLSKDFEMLARVATKVSQIMQDLGSANEIIAPDIQRQLGGIDVVARKAKSQKDPLGTMLAGGRGLGAELTALAGELEDSRQTLHLRPANLQRVVETAFELDHIPPLEEIGSDRTDAPVLRLPSLDQSWDPVTRGLSTRLDPDRLRPIAFDPEVLAPADEGGDPDVVYQHLGSPLLQRATKRLRGALWGTERSIERVTAVVVPGLPESYAVAVTRMVLIGEAGLRLHEEVFLAGTRLAQRTAVGEEKSEALLEKALDADTLQQAEASVLDQLAAAWKNEGRGLRARVASAVEDRVSRRQRDIERQLGARHSADRERVTAIFERFGDTLSDALEQALEFAGGSQLTLFDEERRQAERDLKQIRERIDALGDERERELAAVDARYANVTARTFHAAVIFALAPDDASGEVTIR